MSGEPRNLRQLAEIAAHDGHSSWYFNQPLWISVEDDDRGGYDLYQVTGFEATACQPTLTLRWVEFVRTALT